jgi:hypothetical protein
MELKHNVRNALQTIVYANQADADEQHKMIVDSVDRIDRTLRALFPAINVMKSALDLSDDVLVSKKPAIFSEVECMPQSSFAQEPYLLEYTFLFSTVQPDRSTTSSPKA